MEKNQKKRKVLIWDYIKLFLIVVATVLCIIVFRNIYVSRINYELNIPVITETLLNEITSEEVYNYIRENENATLYIGVASSNECRSFEKEFNSVITNKKLENVITYLNITKASNKSKFIKEFNKFYDTKVLGYPSLIVFEDGKVKDVLTVKEGKKLEIEDAINFIKDNGIKANN